MTIEFKSPQEIAEEYLLHLSSLKPEVNTDQTDSDWFIKSRVYGGVVSGAYADIRRIADDAFPQSARREAVERHLFTYFNEGFNQPTPSNGFALVTGATGSFAVAGSLEMVYNPNGNSYVTVEDVTIDAVTGTPVAVQSIGTGQIQNLEEGAILNISSPPAGFDSTATVTNGPLADGSDVESTEAGANRVLARIREPIRGGTAEDYRQWALESDDAVISANILRYPQGFGSVGIILSAGTTDIDEALDNNLPIVTVPSDALIATVQAYIDARRPLTDKAIVFKTFEEPIDVTVRVAYKQGDGNTILDGQTLTQEELVIREVKRAIYKTPAGGRQIGGSGFVFASDIEQTVDDALSAVESNLGVLEVLVDRQVEDLSATGANRLVSNTQTPIPGTISVIGF